MPTIKLRHPRALASVALYQHQPQRQTGVASLFVIGYSIAAYFAYTTAGQPLAAALAEQVRLEALSNATANGTASAGLDGARATLAGVGAAIPATPKTLSPSPPSPGPKGFDWDDEATEEDELAGLRAADAALDAANATASNGTSTKKERPLPSEWLPSAAVCVGIFLLACSHALFYLMCRWSVDFRLRQLYAPATDVKPGVIVCFRPLPHKGRPMLVPLNPNPNPNPSPNPSPNPNPNPNPNPDPSPNHSPNHSPNPNLSRWAARHAHAARRRGFLRRGGR